MIKKLFLIAFVLLNVKISVAYASNNIPPVLENFRIKATEPSRIYFDSNEPITASTVTGFVLNDNTITNVSINAGQLLNHYFTVSSSFKWFNHNSIRYTGGSDFENQNSIALSKFDLQYIKNNIVPIEGTSSIYYVDASVNSSGDGSSEASAFKTIQEAVNIARAGSKVWIKAGNYGAENIYFPRGGKSDNPITFEGYKDEIDDISSMYFNYENGDQIDASEMPLLDGGNRNIGRAMNFNAAIGFIILRNIQITNYGEGLRTKSIKGVILENILVKNIGKLNKNVGLAIHFSSSTNNASYNKFSNCIVINATAQAFKLGGQNNLIEDCEAYSDEALSFRDINATTDYYFLIRGSSNIVRKSLAKKNTQNGDGHSGHGFSLKASDKACEYNLIELCTSINIFGAYEARHPEVKFNVFKNSISHANVSNRRASNQGSAAINILQGAEANIFEGIYGHHLDVAIRFGDNTEDNTHVSGKDNLIKNCVFDNVKAVLWASNVSRATSRPNGNKIYNSTFNNADFLYTINNSSDPIEFSNNEWKNNIFNNIRKLDNPRGNQSRGWSYSTNNFFDGFTKPSGSGNTSVDPKFVNITVGNFKLTDDSLLIDAGLDIDDVTIDFEGSSRLQGTGIDIGAYEHEDNTISLINANAGPDTEICNAEEAILTATGNGDFLWSTGETTASITVTPNTTTTYTVTVTDTNTNESETDAVTVTVQETPSVTLENDLSICLGEGITLTATGNGDFLWSTGETTSSITVNPTLTTTYSVTASNSCSTTATDDITVTVNPGVILDAGNDITICFGDSVTLSATSMGDFLWSTGETTADITVSPTATTIYTITSTLGSCSVSDEVTVTVEDRPSVNLGEDITLCSGEESVTLTAEGTGDFLWSTGEITASIIVYPTSTTTYTVTANSCNTSVTDEIIVNVTEEIVLNAGEDVLFCPGESVTLTAEGTGNFLWSTGETTASITVNPSVTTTYIVTSTLGSCSVSDQVTAMITASPSVNINGNDIIVCSTEEEIVLRAEGNGDFLWSTGETTSSITVYPTVTDTYSVAITNTCGEVATDEILISVNEPVIAYAGEDIVINEGYSVVLTASGGEEYLWSTGETTESIIVNPTVETIYYVEVSKNGCSDTDAVKVMVDEAVVMINNGLDITICDGEKVELVAKGGVNYLWSTGEVTARIQATPEETTTYFVSALRDGIIQTAEITIYVNNCSGNGNNRISNLNVYPNPTEGLINVFLPDLREKVRLSLVSLNGSLIYNKEVKADNNGVFTQIDLSNMAKGVYFLRMYNKNFNETKKILVI